MLVPLHQVIQDYYCEPFLGAAFELTAEKHSALLEASDREKQGGLRPPWWHVLGLMCPACPHGMQLTYHCLSGYR